MNECTHFYTTADGKPCLELGEKVIVLKMLAWENYLLIKAGVTKHIYI